MLLSVCSCYMKILYCYLFARFRDQQPKFHISHASESTYVCLKHIYNTWRYFFTSFMSVLFYFTINFVSFHTLLWARMIFFVRIGPNKNVIYSNYINLVISKLICLHWILIFHVKMAFNVHNIYYVPFLQSLNTQHQSFSGNFLEAVQKI